MSASVLIEAVEAEGFGRGGVVAAAFGDVQVAGVFEGRDDGGADGGQVGGPAAGAAGGGIFPESKVADVVVRLSVTSQSRFARTVWRASKVTTAPSRSAGPSSSVKWLVSLCLTSISR